ncbi:DUF317 domain-containing protein [Streptomyces sp. URMC 125]|uniref:DUF317 domain-containing protein n=1 Tax=Streptomyces sp. URMC 125 TaxID=3423419 RepID=UPI003F1AE452
MRSTGQDPRPDLPSWQAWAGPADRAPRLWCAAFGHSAPHTLVAAFAAAVADPAPVERRVLPDGLDGQLSFTLFR